MKSLFLLFLITVIVPFANLVAQEDHLQPMNSALHNSEFENTYSSELNRLFYTGERFHTEVSMITDGSWDSESILFLYRNDTFETTRIRQRYFINYKKAHQNVGYLSRLKFENKNKDSLQVGVDKYRFEINTELALKLKRLYKVALLKVSPDLKPIVGSDGVSYYFHAKGYNIRSGMTWSPFKGTKMRELVSINEEIIKMIIAARPLEVISPDDKLLQRIDKLIKRIQTED